MQPKCELREWLQVSLRKNLEKSYDSPWEPQKPTMNEKETRFRISNHFPLDISSWL